MEIGVNFGVSPEVEERERLRAGILRKEGGLRVGNPKVGRKTGEAAGRSWGKELGWQGDLGKPYLSAVGREADSCAGCPV